MLTVQAPSAEVSVGIPPGVLVIVLAFLAMVVMIAVGIPLTRAMARRLEQDKPDAGSAIRGSEIDALRDSVDRLSIEVERIAEGQRWMLREAAESSESRGGPDAR